MGRVTWREDGKRVASVSDDRTVRVWDVDCSDDGFRSPINHGNVGDSGDCSPLVTNEEIEFAAGVVAATTRRLLWTGWGHVSRVWDVGFSCWGVVTAGEVRCDNYNLHVKIAFDDNKLCFCLYFLSIL